MNLRFSKTRVYGLDTGAGSGSGLAIITALHGMQSRYSDGNSVSVRLSVCLSVRLSNACIVTKRNKAMCRFLYHMKEHLSYFYEKENG